MRDTADASERLVAMKVMPTSWVCQSPEEFKEKRPGENENPWTDFEFVNYLSKRQQVVSSKNHLVCDFVGVFRDQECTYFGTAFAPGGDLFSKLEVWDRQELSLEKGREAQVWPVYMSVLRRVVALHNMGISHRDLSLENVVLGVAADRTPNPTFAEEADALRMIDF